jgi:hypothetical protein
MPLYWLVYRHNNQISVVIEPGASIIHARMRASLVIWMKANSPMALKWRTAEWNEFR